LFVVWRTDVFVINLSEHVPATEENI